MKTVQAGSTRHADAAPYVLVEGEPSRLVPGETVNVAYADLTVRGFVLDSTQVGRKRVLWRIQVRTIPEGDDDRCTCIASPQLICAYHEAEPAGYGFIDNQRKGYSDYQFNRLREEV